MKNEVHNNIKRKAPGEDSGYEMIDWSINEKKIKNIEKKDILDKDILELVEEEQLLFGILKDIGKSAGN